MEIICNTFIKVRLVSANLYHMVWCLKQMTRAVVLVPNRGFEFVSIHIYICKCVFYFGAKQVGFIYYFASSNSIVSQKNTACNKLGWFNLDGLGQTYSTSGPLAEYGPSLFSFGN